jgi:hypothetical protein
VTCWPPSAHNSELNRTAATQVIAGTSESYIKEEFEEDEWCLEMEFDLTFLECADIPILV